MFVQKLGKEFVSSVSCVLVCSCVLKQVRRLSRITPSSGIWDFIGMTVSKGLTGRDILANFCHPK